MFKKTFIFPGLHHLGYESGFAVALTPALRRYEDLRVELLWFRDGKRQTSTYLEIPKSPALCLRSWESDWGFKTEEHNPTDLYCLRMSSPAHPQANLPEGGLEGQMLLRHRTHGWTSTILTGFIPARGEGHRFAPIIHTGHCMANAATNETITLFMNVKNIDAPAVTDGGIITAAIYDLSGNIIGKKTYPVLGNATVALSHDRIASDCGISPAQLQQGVNIKFYGGDSQFAIITLFHHRTQGSIAIEHSLAPLYYIPELKNPAIRTLVYSQMENA